MSPTHDVCARTRRTRAPPALLPRTTHEAYSPQLYAHRTVWAHPQSPPLPPRLMLPPLHMTQYHFSLFSRNRPSCLCGRPSNEDFCQLRVARRLRHLARPSNERYNAAAKQGVRRQGWAGRGEGRMVRERGMRGGRGGARGQKETGGASPRRLAEHHNRLKQHCIQPALLRASAAT